MKERPADMVYFIADGFCGWESADENPKAKSARMEVVIGRADSKRTLGFIVRDPRKPEKQLDFVLTKKQVARLIWYLNLQALRLLPHERTAKNKRPHRGVRAK
jgi:hypothetical protein